MWNQSNVRSENMEHLQHKVSELKRSNKNKNVRNLCNGVIEFKTRCQCRALLIKCDLLAGSHHFVSQWINYFSRLLTYLWASNTCCQTISWTCHWETGYGIYRWVCSSFQLQCKLQVKTLFRDALTRNRYLRKRRITTSVVISYFPRS